MVRKAVGIGSFEGMDINGKCFVDILQFRDDTLLVGMATWKHLWAINISSNFLEATIIFLACRIEDSEFVFLGIPIGHNPRRIATCKSLIMKMKKRFLNWKNRFLSFGGRVTLLKFVLCPLSIFTLSFYKLLIFIATEIVKLQSNFLWGEMGEKRKIHWVRWMDVCLSFKKVGWA